MKLETDKLYSFTFSNTNAIDGVSRINGTYLGTEVYFHNSAMKAFVIFQAYGSMEKTSVLLSNLVSVQKVFRLF